MEDRTFEVSLCGRTWRITGPLPDYVTGAFVGGTYYEAALLHEILNRYGKGGCYIDFGAFIGTHTLFFALACVADLVVAVEPTPASFAYLSRNLEQNSVCNVEAYNVAVGTVKGRCLPIAGPDAGGTSWRPTDTAPGSCPMLAAESLVTCAPKLIKIDCEQSTLDVLLGLRPVVEEHRPVMVVEIGYGEDRISPIMTDWNYRHVNTFCATPTGIWEAI